LAISRTADDALLLLRDGSMVTGELFVVNDQTVSLLNENGIVRYQRADISQVVFLTSRNVLALRTEGRVVDEKIIEGEAFYIGGSWDGLPAGNFKATLHHPTSDDMHDHLMLRTEFFIERNGFSRGTLKSLVVGKSLPASVGATPVSDQLAGVVLDGAGEYLNRGGAVDVSVVLDLEGPERKLKANYIFRF